MNDSEKEYLHWVNVLQNLALNDEVLLEKIKLMNEEEEDNTVLTPEENAVILVAW